MITKKKLEKIGELSFKNAVRLHTDSAILYKKGSFASAYFLSVLAIEELGKVHMIEKALGWDDSLGEYEQEILNKLYDHSTKQGYFYHNSYFKNWFDGTAKHKAFLDSISKGELEKTKQNSVYVGLPKNRRVVDTVGKLSSPFKVTDKKASEQITIVSDEILSLTVGHIYEIYGVDNPQLTQHLTRGFFSQMQKLWNPKSKKARKHFNTVVSKFIKENKPLKIL